MPAGLPFGIRHNDQLAEEIIAIERQPLTALAAATLPD